MWHQGYERHDVNCTEFSFRYETDAIMLKIVGNKTWLYAISVLASSLSSCACSSHGTFLYFWSCFCLREEGQEELSYWSWNTSIFTGIKWNLQIPTIQKHLWLNSILLNLRFHHVFKKYIVLLFHLPLREKNHCQLNSDMSWIQSCISVSNALNHGRKLHDSESMN